MRPLLPLVFCLISQLGFAQILDTSQAHDYRSLNSYQLSEQGLHYLQEDSTIIDTSLLGFYESYPQFDGKPRLDLGYEGSPSYDLGAYHTPDMRLMLGVSAIKNHFYSAALNRYHTDRPFTRLNYSQGPNELVYIEAQHGQQFSERLTVALDYRRLKNHNFYFYNISNPDRVRFTNLFNSKLVVGYHSADRKYEMLTGHIWNKNTQMVTGGLKDTDAFESAEGRTKTNNMLSNLSDAKSSINQHIFKLSQFYRYKGGDLDSTRPHSMQRFSAQLTLNSTYRRETLEYSDNAPDSSFYGDSLGAFADSVFASSFSNRLGHVMRWKNNMVLTGVTYVFDHLYQAGHIEDFNSVYLDASYRYNPTLLDNSFWFKYGITGYNSGDLLIKNKSVLDIGGGQINLLLEHKRTEANYLHRSFVSPARNWAIDLNKISSSRAKITGQISGKSASIKLFTSVQNIDQLVFFDTSGTAQQAANAVQLFRLGITAAYHHKYFGLDVNTGYQYSSDQEVLPRPEWTAGGRIYTQLKIFKGKLLTQWGIETNWFSDFNALGYDPLIRQWRLNNETFSKYPPVQLFVNAKVKSFNFGLTLFHAQQGLMGEKYYSAPNYPVMPQVIRFNVRWDLVN